MGQTAENVAEFAHVTREEMDEFAVLSQHARGDVRRRTGSSSARSRRSRSPTAPSSHKDDGPRPGTTIEKLSQLKPVFRPDGTVTAGNACPLNDGAAAVVVMSDTRAEQLGITPLARIVASGVTALEPRDHGARPDRREPPGARARRAHDGRHRPRRDQRGVRGAGRPLGASDLGIPWDKLNVNGGAIALGHPFGMTGARIMTTLLNGLEDRGGRYGLETMCVGGGQGMAMIVERLS